ncbi:MAG TPA: hypothetical protein VKY15_02630 [Acidimicrobiales bacterium]|nr:hypothetical protein [Acidimicrobiales bacterium]
MPRPRLVLILAAGLVVLAAGPVVSAQAAGAWAGGGQVRTECDHDDAVQAWPADTSGYFPVTSGLPRGFWLGQVDGVWELKVTHRENRRPVHFSGTVATDGTLVAGPVALEPADSFRLSRHDHLLSFDLVDHGHIDGLSFTAACASHLALHLEVDGQDAPAALVNLGQGQAHPPGNPFVVASTSDHDRWPGQDPDDHRPAR